MDPQRTRSAGGKESSLVPYESESNFACMHVPDKRNFEDTTSPKLAALKMLRPYPFNGLWLTINTYKEPLKARKHFEKRN